MKKDYLKPELELLELEVEPMLAGTGATDNPSKPLPDVDFSREVTFEED
ncbi:MAG: hypothetical protein K6D37_02625 [Prevotella sp.]|nr:hypothetical protein [Prevotella sp.]